MEARLGLEGEPDGAHTVVVEEFVAKDSEGERPAITTRAVHHLRLRLVVPC
jgi:hypothetical protein